MIIMNPVCHLSNNYYMQAQCRHSIYIISNIHKQSFGICSILLIDNGD